MTYTSLIIRCDLAAAFCNWHRRGNCGAIIYKHRTNCSSINLNDEEVISGMSVIELLSVNVNSFHISIHCLLVKEV